MTKVVNEASTLHKRETLLCIANSELLQRVVEGGQPRKYVTVTHQENL